MDDRREPRDPHEYSGDGERLKDLLGGFLERARDYVSAHPTEGLLFSFLAGLVLGLLGRRER